MAAQHSLDLLQSESLYQKITWRAELGSLRGLQLLRVVVNDSGFTWVWSMAMQSHAETLCNHHGLLFCIKLGNYCQNANNFIMRVSWVTLLSRVGSKTCFPHGCHFPPVVIVVLLEPAFPWLSTLRGGLAFTWLQFMKQPSNCRLL